MQALVTNAQMVHDTLDSPPYATPQTNQQLTNVA